MGNFDERQVSILRRKLDALSYAEVLDPVSAPLVQKLLEDLVHTTESYRTLKLQHAKQAQEISSFSSKLEVLKLDAGRTASENNQLHAQLIQQAERFDAREKEHYQNVKHLEDRVAELSYWKHQAMDRFQQMEKANLALKKRVEELLRVSERRAQGGHPPRDDATKILMLDQAAPPKAAVSAPGVPHPSVDVLKASEARLSALQVQLLATGRELQEARQHAQDLQSQVKRRDDEIARLGARAGDGPDMDRLSLEHRNEANENLILSLNQQVEYLTAQLSDMEEQVKDFRRLETALAQADASKTEAENKLAAAVKENAAIQKELQQLKKQVTQMQQRMGKAGKSGAAALDASLNAVTETSKKLAEVTAERDDLEARLRQATSSQMEAAAQLSGLKEQLETLQFLVDEARAQAEDAKQQAVTAKDEAEEHRQRMSAQQVELQQVQQQLARGRQEAEMKEAVVQKLQEERDTATARLSELQQQASDGQQNLTQYQFSASELESRVAGLESELRVASSNLVAADAEVEALRKQIRETAEAKVKAASHGAQNEDECARLRRDVDALSSQLEQTRRSEEQLTMHRDHLEAEMGHAKAQVSVLASERDALQSAANAADAAARDRAAKLHTSTRELGQLQGLQSRLEAQQEQARITALRLADSESEVARLRVEAARAGEAVMRAEGDVADLRRLLDEADADRAALRERVQEADGAAVAAAAKLRSVEAERTRLAAERQVAVDELRSLRQTLDHEAASGRASESSLSSAQAKVSALQRQLAIKDEDLDRLQQQLREAQQLGHAAQVREEEARAQGFEYAERARRAETLVEEYEAELAMLRAEQEKLSRELKQSEAEAAAQQEQLLQRGKEVEQLTTLSLRGDATVQEYMANLRAMATSLRATELRCNELSSRLAARTEEIQACSADLQESNRVVASLDAERDSLQEELDSRAEREVALLNELELCHKQQDEAHRLRAAAEGRLAHCTARLKQSESETGAVRQELDRTLKAMDLLERQFGGLREEYRAVSEDLEALVKENQVVSNELVKVTRQLESTSSALRKAEGRVVATEQAMRAREVELEDLARAYSALASEQRRCQGVLVGLERGVHGKEEELAAAQEEIRSLQGSLREAESQIGQMSLDISAFERHVDVLSRQLSRGECDSDELDREKHQLLQELKAAQQVRLALERAREEMQRQLMAAEGQVAGLQGRVQDAASEARSLHGRWQQERQRVAELEVLLGNMRAQSFQEAVGSPKVQVEADRKVLSVKAGQLQEQLSRTEKEAADLRQQVDELMKERERQQAAVREGELQMEALRKAVASAETAGGDSAELAGELAAREAVARKMQGEAQRRCMELQEEVEKLRREHSAAQQQLRHFQHEHNRLVDTLAETDCEKTQLQRDNAELHKALAAMKASGGHRGLEGHAGTMASQSSIASVSASHEPASSVSSTELQAEMEKMRHEMDTMQSNLAKSGQLIHTLYTELSRAQREYGFASSSLQSLGLEMASSVGTPFTPPSVSSFVTQG